MNLISINLGFKSLKEIERSPQTRLTIGPISTTFSFFMNYRYGSEWNPESPWKEGLGGDVSALLGFNHYSDALDDIWNHLNSDPHNLKTMLDLTDSSSSLQWTKLGKTEQKEYEELINLSKEVGRYPLYQELADPFSTENEDTRGQPLVILKRFGYNSPTELYDKTQLKATTGQTLRAPLAGKVAISGNQVRISTKEAIFTYEAVGGIRVKDQSSVTVGEEIGKVTTDGYQEIRYQKEKQKPRLERLKNGRRSILDSTFHLSPIIRRPRSSPP